MEDDRQTDEQTESEFDARCDSQPGQARGRERRLYSPRETGLILTYALEWNEDWHDLLIWAVAAHDGRGRSPVTLLHAWRMSCHRDRSKIQIHFLLRVDSNWATRPDFHPSLYLPLFVSTWQLLFSVLLYNIAISDSFFAHFCLCIVFCFKLGATCCEGEERVCRSLEGLQDFHLGKRSCFDTSSNAIFNWWQ